MSTSRPSLLFKQSSREFMPQQPSGLDFKQEYDHSLLWTAAKANGFTVALLKASCPSGSEEVAAKVVVIVDDTLDEVNLVLVLLLLVRALLLLLLMLENVIPVARVAVEVDEEEGASCGSSSCTPELGWAWTIPSVSASTTGSSSSGTPSRRD
jgi:hypothetical protein